MALALRQGGTIREDSILVPQLRFMQQRAMTAAARGGSWPLAVASPTVLPEVGAHAPQEEDEDAFLAAGGGGGGGISAWSDMPSSGLLMSASNQVTAYDLHERINERKHRNCDSFRIIQERCYARISRCAQVAPTHCSIWYEAPAFIVGRPPFDVQRCIELLSGNLRANGYRVTHFPPRLLFITWDLSAPARPAPRLVVGGGATALHRAAPPPRLRVEAPPTQRGDALAPDRTVALPAAADFGMMGGGGGGGDARSLTIGGARGGGGGGGGGTGYRPISDFKPRARLMLGL